MAGPWEAFARLTDKKARQTDLAGRRAGMLGGLLLGEVEAVELHDLGPRGDEVLDELLLGVGARVDFREGAELRYLPRGGAGASDRGSQTAGWGTLLQGGA